MYPSFVITQQQCVKTKYLKLGAYILKALLDITHNDMLHAEI